MPAPNDAALVVACPTCQAKPGHSCTQPTDTGRRQVLWYHSQREADGEAHRLAIGRQVDALLSSEHRPATAHRVPFWPKVYRDNLPPVTNKIADEAREVAEAQRARTTTTVSITQVFTVPDAHILALIDCAAGRHGIGYWAESGIITDERTYVVTPDEEAREDPTIQTRTLKFEWIAKRLVQLGVGSPLLKGVGINDQAREYLADLVNPDESVSRDADSNFDADLADVVIQLAFFDGSVVFG